MTETYYPYRSADGGRSVLMAVDRADARQYLASPGKKTVFCEVEMNQIRQDEILASKDKNQIIDRFLETRRNFVT